MHKTRALYRLHFQDKDFLQSVFLALMLLGASLLVNFYAGMYATAHASSPVTDIILNNIRTYDVDGMFIYGPMVFWFFVTLYLLLRPTKLPFTVKSIALFIFIRSLFIVLTHIGPFPGEIISQNNTLHWFTFGGDLFFSAHTGLPFLLALLFWEERGLRYFFIASSIFFAIVVLLGHYHYSIDVFAAYFVTYAIKDVAQFSFKKDYALFTAVRI